MKFLFNWRIAILVFSVFMIFMLPFNIVATDVTEYKHQTEHEILLLKNKIDSLELQLNKKDTIIIKPLKIEIYDSRKS